MPGWTDVIIDAVTDTAKLILPLIAVYMLIEYIEEKKQHGFLERIGSENKAAPFWGAIFGCIPQCGFSGIAAELYSHRFITVGAMLAVFLSTADEALPVLISHLTDNPSRAALGIAMIILVKLLTATLIGLAVDFAVKSYRRKKHTKDEKCEHFRSLEECSEETDCGNHHGECGCHHDGEHKGFVKGILLPSLKHTAKITVFILAVNLILGFAIFFIGEDSLSTVLLSGSVFQPIVAAALGLIPNCAVSVMLTELWLEGTLSFASAMAGLSAGAGVGLLVLFRSNKHIKQNVNIVITLFLSGVAVGYFVMGISAIFGF